MNVMCQVHMQLYVCVSDKCVLCIHAQVCVRVCELVFVCVCVCA